MSPTNYTTIDSIDNIQYKNLCEALDCSNIAKYDIEVSAGKYGMISIKVCHTCLSKFKTNSKSNDYSESNDSSLFMIEHIRDEDD